MDSKLRKMGILASMAVILLVALAVMYVNREQLSPTSGGHRGDGHRGSGWQDRQRPESLFKR